MSKAIGNPYSEKQQEACLRRSHFSFGSDMKYDKCRAIVFGRHEYGAFCVVLWCFCAPLPATEIRLKNGIVLHGKLLVMDSLLDRPDKQFATLVEPQSDGGVPGHKHSIACVDNDWRRIHFPFIQGSMVEAAADANSLNPRLVKFTLPLRERPKTRLKVNPFESRIVVEPFSDFGFRRLSIESSTKPVHVFQAITEVTPDHILVESINCRWKIGLGLNAIPADTLGEILKRHLDKSDPVARLELVRFFAQAGYFPQASRELAVTAQDFPENSSLIVKADTELMSQFGHDIFLRLVRCQRAGQHVRAETFAKQLATLPLDGPAKLHAAQTIKSYDQWRKMIEHAKWLQKECQSRLHNQEHKFDISRFSSELDENLDFETLSRLQAFLDSESSDQFETEQRLALAVSGWVMGSANVICDFDQAMKLWHARNMIFEYLQSGGFAHLEQLEQLLSEENFTPKKIHLLISLLPPFMETRDVEPGKASQLETQSQRHSRYSVMLPAEYSANHKYPLIVALRSRNHSTEQTLWRWSGNDQNPDLGADRGYIVIAPDFPDSAANDQVYDEEVQGIVLECLADARNRLAVDSDRVFLAGHGMGADAAFHIGMAHPDEFAGVLPICGDATDYCTYYWKNSSRTAWYVMGKGYDSQGILDRDSQPLFERILKSGSEFDFMLVEYLGRNGEDASEELPKLFDWMDLHVRPDQPKQFNVRSLRRKDNRFFWLTVTGLPRDYLLSDRSKKASQIKPMEIEASVKNRNKIQLISPAQSYILRLTPDLIDFDKRLIVKIGDHVEFNDYVKPDIGVFLEELRQTGDRNRAAFAVLSP